MQNTKTMSDSKNLTFTAQKYVLDFILLLSLALLAGAVSYQNFQPSISPIFKQATIDLWFDADVWSILQDLTGQGAEHLRSSIHPLFPLIGYSLVYGLSKVFSLEPLAAVRWLMALMACLWSGGLFLLFRLMGCQRLDAYVWGVLACVSAASMFWFSVPETYAFAAPSILAALLLAAFAQRTKPQLWLYILTSAATLSITTTNWMVGLLATLITRSRKHFVIVTALALGLVILLTRVQDLILPNSVFFISRRISFTQYS
jgi:hypothetical protein